MPGFVVQGGDPTGSGTGGPGYSVDEQPPQNLSYTHGVVAMAKSPTEPSRRLMAKLRVGDSAPDFDLEGTGSRRYGLADFRSTGVILAFYPGDFTPVCTKQFCSYRDDGDRIEALGMPMVGISPQSVSSHERFADRHGLTVPLLSDPDKKVARKYGVLGPGGFIRRAIFLVDPAGTVRYRNVALFGLRYQDVGDLERAISEVQPEAGLA